MEVLLGPEFEEAGKKKVRFIGLALGAATSAPALGLHNPPVKTTGAFRAIRGSAPYANLG
jgi:hypothetical protein